VRTSLLGLVVLAVVVAAAGCGGVSTQPNGAWTACGNVTRPSAVQVRRTVPVRSNGRDALSVTERRTALVRSLYLDACVIAGHPVHLQSGEATSCPDDFSLGYSGIFYDGRTKIAAFSYAASGCETLTLSVGQQRATTMIVSSKVVLDTQMSLDAALATALGVPVRTIHRRPA
jgi:hypothetical protein